MMYFCYFCSFCISVILYSCFSAFLHFFFSVFLFFCISVYLFYCISLDLEEKPGGGLQLVVHLQHVPGGHIGEVLTPGLIWYSLGLTAARRRSSSSGRSDEDNKEADELGEERDKEL